MISSFGILIREYQNCFLLYRKLSIPEVRAAYQGGSKNGRNVSDVNSYKPHKYCTKTVEK